MQPYCAHKWRSSTGRTRTFSRETALILRYRLRTKQPKAVDDKRGEDRMWGAAHGQTVNEPFVVSPRPISASIASMIGRGRTTSSWLRLRSPLTASTKRSMYLGCMTGKPSVCFQLYATGWRKTENSFISRTEKIPISILCTVLCAMFFFFESQYYRLSFFLPWKRFLSVYKMKK